MKQIDPNEIAIAELAMAAALDGMAEHGATDDAAAHVVMNIAIRLAAARPTAVDADAVVRLALGLIGGAHGGLPGIIDWCERQAAALRVDPDALPPTIN